MSDHRRVLREMMDEEAEILGQAEPAYVHTRARARHDALTAALAALEDRARLRERVEALPRYDVKGEAPTQYGPFIVRHAVLALLSDNLRGSLERRVECEHDYNYDGYYFTCRACGQRIGAN